MDKKLKDSLNESPLSLYNMEWVEESADKGFDVFKDMLKKISSAWTNTMLDDKNATRALALLYYSAFESALNTFLTQVLEDHLNEIVLSMDELCKVTAQMKKKGE